MTAATEVWTKPEDLTDAQKAIKVVMRWRCIEVLPDGCMKTVDEITGVLSNFTPAVITLQGLEIGDSIEVREGATRDLDVVILYKSGVKYES
ncbi:hypothetical protein D3C80_1834000 [compost metagenome]